MPTILPVPPGSPQPLIPTHSSQELEPSLMERFTSTLRDRSPNFLEDLKPLIASVPESDISEFMLTAVRAHAPQEVFQLFAQRNIPFSEQVLIIILPLQFSHQIDVLLLLIDAIEANQCSLNLLHEAIKSHTSDLVISKILEKGITPEETTLQLVLTHRDVFYNVQLLNMLIDKISDTRFTTTLLKLAFSKKVPLAIAQRLIEKTPLSGEECADLTRYQGIYPSLFPLEANRPSS